jgi:hypothetical protein
VRAKDGTACTEGAVVTTNGSRNDVFRRGVTRRVAGWSLFVLAFSGCEKMCDKAFDGCTCIGMHGVAGVVIGTQEADRAQRIATECGKCPAGQACNLGYPLGQAVCRPSPGALGEICASDAQGLVRYDFPCADPLVCSVDERKCVTPAKRGEPCELRYCAKALKCRTPLGGGKATCDPPAIAGERCDEFRACDAELSNLHCDTATNTCRPD